jgi:uncharacterized membrane protein YidH (DUF202 family)
VVSDPKSTGKSGIGEGIGGVVDIVRAYVKQETVDPLKSVGRYLGAGIGGALLIGLGLSLLLLGFLRVLQVETAPHLTGSWSWVPYLLTLVLTGLLLVLMYLKMRKDTPHG